MTQNDPWNELDDDDMVAIGESEEQIRQGRERPFKEAAEELRRNLLTISAGEHRR